jgi:hypothetical protein
LVLSRSRMNIWNEWFLCICDLFMMGLILGVDKVHGRELLWVTYFAVGTKEINMGSLNWRIRMSPFLLSLSRP